MKSILLADVRRTLLLASAALLAAGCAGGVLQARPEDIPALEQQTAAAPQDEQARTRLGIAYYNAGRFQDARTTLTALTSKDTKESAAWLYLGLTQEKLEDWAGAREAYARYLAINPGSSSERMVRDRIALVGRNELRQQARALLEREQLLAQQEPTPGSIAVMPFQATGLSEELRPLQTALADMVITDLGFTQLRSIERVRVQSMLDEMKLGIGGVTSEETRARVGRLLRANYLVQGQLTATQGQQLAVAATVLNTVRRTPTEAGSQQGTVDAIFDLEKQMVFDILRAADYSLSQTEREKINENRVANLIAFLAYGRGLEAMDRGEYQQARDLFQQATQADPNFGAARTQQNQASQLTQAQNTSTEQVAQTAAPEVVAPPTAPSTMTQQVANDVNPSPAPAVAASAPASAPPAQTRAAPTTEPQTQSPAAQATKTTIILPILNPLKK